jgi:hypothetical protein
MFKPLLVAGAAVGVVLVALFWGGVLDLARSHRAESSRPMFVRDVNNDKRIAIRGSEQHEIESLLQEFANQYGEVFVDTGPSVDAGATLLTFPRDIAPDQFLRMVSFLAYAKERDAPDSLAVVGKATLNAGFGLPDAALAGRRAFIYVPENDRGRDIVYVEVVGEGIYAVPLGNWRWRRAESPRQPSWVHKL